MNVSNLPHVPRNLCTGLITAALLTACGGSDDEPDAGGSSSSGTGAPIVGESGTVTSTIVGTKTIGTDTVDKVNYPGSGPTVLKNIAFVSADGLSLRVGGRGTLDADAYPTVLDTTVYTKQ